MNRLWLKKRLVQEAELIWTLLAGLGTSEQVSRSYLYVDLSQLSHMPRKVQ